MEHYQAALKKYAEFSGRAQRAEYWHFTLINLFIYILLTIIGGLIGDDVGAIAGLFNLAVLIPGLAVSIRRLHDVGKSGWMLLISLIPLVGFVWLLVLMVRDGVPGENKYGPNPKETTPAK